MTLMKTFSHFLFSKKFFKSQKIRKRKTDCFNVIFHINKAWQYISYRALFQNTWSWTLYRHFLLWTRITSAFIIGVTNLILMLSYSHCVFPFAASLQSYINLHNCEPSRRSTTHTSFLEQKIVCSILGRRAPCNLSFIIGCWMTCVAFFGQLLCHETHCLDESWMCWDKITAEVNKKVFLSIGVLV